MTVPALSPGAVVDLPAPPWLLTVDGPLDLSAVVLGADGRVSGDADLVFFNQPSAPGVRLQGVSLAVDAARLRAGAVRVVLLASAADGVSAVPRTRLSVAAGGRPVATCAVGAGGGETVVQLAEVYRRGSGWRLRALGDGYADGLAGLARVFGVEVDDEPGRDDEDASPAAQVLALTNRERVQRGLVPVVAEPRLRLAAQRHNDDMVARGYFAHESPDGRTVADRVRDAGYPYALVAENIAAGQRTPAEVVQGWMDSPGHRRNLLSADVRELGVGVTAGGSHGTTWTQVFGARH